jgi:3-isopropylmalate/(R)-2-methylmalate dehydratase small subunit
MIQFSQLISRLVLLPVENIDTDQIIPARYLKATSKEGMGEALFADWRYNSDGMPRTDFILNKPEANGAQILLAGDNFGCGSSREHAVWALTGFGFRAIISTSFADIFCSNALKNGLLPISIAPEEHAALFTQISGTPETELQIDLYSQTVKLPGGESIHFTIDQFSKACLLKGVDELGYLLSFIEHIQTYEQEGRYYENRSL